MADRMSFEDWSAILAVLNRYAEMVDTRSWQLAEQVFTDDATGAYGGENIVGGPGALVAFFRSRLDGCGPTQHLLGNYSIGVHGDEAQARCSARMHHQGAGERAGLEPYEAFGDYEDLLVRTADGWRIRRRSLTIRMSRGDPAVLHG